jgi:hypothetical protein
VKQRPVGVEVHTGFFGGLGIGELNFAVQDVIAEPAQPLNLFFGELFERIGRFEMDG